MTLPQIDIGRPEVIAALRRWIATQLGDDVPIVQAQANRVAPPLVRNEADPSTHHLPRGWVQLLWVDSRRASTPTTSLADGVQTSQITNFATVQADFVGPEADRWAQLVQDACQNVETLQDFQAGVLPLYADDPRQTPVFDDSAQANQRWMLSITVQYDPTVSRAVDTLTAATIVPVLVDSGLI